jgi:hypothetical protein
VSFDHGACSLGHDTADAGRTHVPGKAPLLVADMAPGVYQVALAEKDAQTVTVAADGLLKLDVSAGGAVRATKK